MLLYSSDFVPERFVVCCVCHYTRNVCFFVFFSSHVIRCISGRKWKEITADCFTEIVTAAYAASSVYHNVDWRSFVSHTGSMMQMQF